MRGVFVVECVELEVRHILILHEFVEFISKSNLEDVVSTNVRANGAEFAGDFVSVGLDVIGHGL